MLKVISAIAALTASLVPATAPKPQPKPVPPPAGTIVVRVVPQSQDKAATPNYAIEGETPSQPMPLPATPQQTADARYNELKAKLDERFAFMFDLKKELEAQQSDTQKKWEEYYALRNAYERQLKKLIADWVSNQLY